MKSFLLFLILSFRFFSSLYSDDIYGVYKTPENGYFGEIIELKKDGSFRYWSFSDVKSGTEPKQPFIGTYTTDKNIVTLNNENISMDKRYITTINGVRVLLRSDGYKIWEKEKRLSSYGLTIQTHDYSDNATSKLFENKDITFRPFPLIETLYSGEVSGIQIFKKGEYDILKHLPDDIKQYYDTKDSKAEYLIIIKNDNGSLKNIYEYTLNKDKTHIRNGLDLSFYDNGQIEKIWPYKDNKRDGYIACYFENGKIDYLLQRKGDGFNGLERRWNKDGVMFTDMQNVDNKPFNGFKIKRAANNNEIVWYENGKLIKSAPCDKDGNLTK